MAALRVADFQEALGFVREAEAVAGPDPFPTELLDRLRALVPCESVTYCELDRVRQQVLFVDACTNGRAQPEPPPDDIAAFWRLLPQIPIAVHHARTLDFAARKLSDFVTRRQLRRREFYADLFHPWGIEYRLVVGLPAPLSRTKCFMFDNGRRDFIERDRLLLDLLRPHFVQLCESAKARRLAIALSIGAEASGELVILDSAGRIEFASVSARRLLRDYGDRADGTAVPQAIEDGLVRDRRHLNGDTLPSRRRPLKIDREHRRLVVTRLSGDGRTLLLAEEPVRLTDSKLLSAREWQIVGLVEAGQSNAEIAATLWIAPGTVRTHLEHIYAKLGVRSRTAALARVRELKLADTP